MLRVSVCALLAAACLFGAALGEDISGQRYDTFIDYYADNLTFINENDGRHLLPLTVKKVITADGNGSISYEAQSGALALALSVEPMGLVITRCQITLTAPPDMEYGSTDYNNFAISGYQSYAMLMAMDANTEAYDRYKLVTGVVEGMADDGEYSVQLGVYSLRCTREGSVATLLFEHRLVAQPAQTPDVAPAAEPDIQTVDEGGGIG